ncbi:MAG: DNA replication/repair protein RecF [Odoribacter sp.]|nr:DNA replication/repair protein RecF [Odoribacter sp.]
MRLKELNIVNFKNIGEATLTFTSGFNCFVGKNGVGKTNILDAIYHLSMCKSYFNLSDTQNIRHDEPFFVVQGKYERDGEEIEVYCGVKRGFKKTFKKNQKAYDKLSEHIGLLPLVMISPEDVILIDGGSEERRKLMDGIISQCDRNYLHHLIRYNKALQQRNSLLRNFSGKYLEPEMVEIWNEQLAESGGCIMQMRIRFLQEFKAVFQSYYERLSLGREEVELEYKPAVSGGDLLVALRDSLERDRYLGYTTTGVHRDDLMLNIGKYSVRKIGSQGQKKTFLIALKLAQYAWLNRMSGVKPLLLLDDIFDKLDADRVSQIVSIVKEEQFGQVFITDTNREHMDDILRMQQVDYRLFTVDKGEILMSV